MDSLKAGTVEKEQGRQRFIDAVYELAASETDDDNALIESFEMVYVVRGEGIKRFIMLPKRE